MRRLGDIGLFTILSESAVASGVRRIEALTSEGARQYLMHQSELAREAAAALKTNPAELPARVAQLAEERRRLERELVEAKRALALAGPAKSDGGDVKTIDGINTVLRVVEGVIAEGPEGPGRRSQGQDRLGRRGLRGGGRRHGPRSSWA